MDDFLQMQDRHILVTGATGGIGRQTAITLSHYGAIVTILGRNEERLKQTMSMLSGEGHYSVSFDLSNIQMIEAMIKEIVQISGPFDGYVQCAGVSKDLPLNSGKFEKIHELMLTNFYSFYELVRVITRKGRYNPGLSIVGVSSTASECGVPSNTAYSASKAAMNGSMRSMARELSAKGIRVNTVLPGPTNTEMYRDYLAMKAEVHSQEQVSSTVSRNYLGVNEPEDVANAIAFLLSPVSRMITGIELPVDAGYMSC